jgi:hypothetical protein
MVTPAYRLTNSITVDIQCRHRLIELPAGSIIYPSSVGPDANGMVDGICNGDVVMVFSRDLEERAEPIYALVVAGNS